VTPVGVLALIVLFFFLHVGAQAAFGGWVFSYATAQGLANATVAAYLTSVYWIAITLGRLLAIPLAARLSAQTLLTGDLLGCLASVGIVLLFPDSLLVLGIGGFGLGLAIARELAQGHGGDLALVETGPAGSTFELRLPGAPAPLAAPRRRSKKAAG
jgi:hypothetical protein